MKGRVAHPDEEWVADEMARELESLAAMSDVSPSPGFADSVIAAVVEQPLPQPVRAFGLALAAGRPRAAGAAIGDAWRVTTSGFAPALVRAQALALVLMVALLSLGVVGGTAAATLGLLSPQTTPTPSIPPSPSPAPTASPSPSPTPSDSAQPLETPNATEGRTAEPTARDHTPSPTATGTDDHSGGSGSGSGSGSGDGSGSGSGSSGSGTGSGSGSGSDSGTGSGSGTSGTGSGSGGDHGGATETPRATGTDDHGGSDG